MRGIKAKKVRHAVARLFKEHRNTIVAACEDKADMPNRHGRLVDPVNREAHHFQHLVINPIRQAKKFVLREGVV